MSIGGTPLWDGGPNVGRKGYNTQALIVCYSLHWSSFDCVIVYIDQVLIVCSTFLTYAINLATSPMTYLGN
jgi:hypothetical protein